MVSKDRIDLFSIDDLDPSMTLSEVFSKYPEVFEIYRLKYVSVEEAEESIRNGMHLIEGDDYYAKEFLSILNDRRAIASNTTAITTKTVNYLNGYRSGTGAAWPYISKTGSTPNCYGYALGINNAIDPGTYSGSTIQEGASVSTLVTKVQNDMVSAFGGAGREISAYNATIYSYEWRVACRTGSAMIHSGSAYIEVWDYHFMLESSDKGWCHKQGSSPSAYLGNINPSNYTWDSSGFYNSVTKYLALNRE